MMSQQVPGTDNKSGSRDSAVGLESPTGDFSFCALEEDILLDRIPF